MVQRFRVATRGSPLARWQAARISNLLTHSTDNSDPEVELVVIETTGDLDRITPLDQIGGQGAFVKEIQAAVLEGRADIAVHSAKDLPAVTPDGLVLAAVPERADPRDALVGCRWADLPQGATVAAGSIRRQAHLRHLRPDLRFVGLRGNIGTRLDKATEFTAGVVAAAALDRLGIMPDIVDRLDPEVLLPQVGQGALAVECRSDDDSMRLLLAALDNSVVSQCLNAERAFLGELGSGCDLPIAAHAVVADNDIVLTGAISSSDGSVLLRAENRGIDGLLLGQSLARHLLDDQGGKALLEQ